ncbi:hypothetical protein PIB30_058185 [Stylosanthes scabra]|uniref:RRM domain-containing protein n=1 Tax=Stylosanthes scabra TaxID=79078 RepID=A0ABU6VLL8_9FABA|nr:hypothetical protein [Stylosanthes scabra]
MEEVSDTIFVDNLPCEIARGTLFKIFGREGNVVDVYVSRKCRKESSLPFAFLRYDSRGGFENRRTPTNVGRRFEESKRKEALAITSGVEKRGNEGNEGITVKKQLEGRQVVKVEAQEDLLKRSIIAKSVEEIFLRVTSQIVEGWKGQGQVECRDMGPYSCIMSFDSVDIRDAALKDLLLLSPFDVLRPQEGVVRTFYQRILLELVGVPVYVWCKKMLWRIGQVWGKPMMTDDTTELKQSSLTHM